MPRIQNISPKNIDTKIAKQHLRKKSKWNNSQRKMFGCKSTQLELADQRARQLLGGFQFLHIH